MQPYWDDFPSYLALCELTLARAPVPHGLSRPPGALPLAQRTCWWCRPCASPPSGAASARNDPAPR
jgi:hypothetical protein